MYVSRCRINTYHSWMMLIMWLAIRICEVKYIIRYIIAKIYISSIFNEYRHIINYAFIYIFTSNSWFDCPRFCFHCMSHRIRDSSVLSVFAYPVFPPSLFMNELIMAMLCYNRVRVWRVDQWIWLYNLNMSSMIILSGILL